MKRSHSIIYLILLNLVASGVAWSQRNHQDFINKYLEKRDSHNAYSFDVTLESKWFSMDDTFKHSAVVECVRLPTDTVFGGIIYIELDSLIFAYDGEQLIRVDKLTSTAETGDPISHPGLWIASTWVNDFVEYAFLRKKQDLRSILNQTDIKTDIVDTLVNNWPCLGIYLHFPDDGDFVNQFVFVAIDTVEYMVRNRVISIWFQENQQFQSWTYHHPKYGQQTSIARLNSSLLSLYTIKDEYKPAIRDTTLKYTIDYSALQGKILGQEQPISLKDVSADVYILDFWYSSCYPCIKSIPEVNKLHERFKDKNVKVYGVNIIDDEAANKSRIEKYMRNNPMQYETIMADGKTYNSWVQNGYPTLLILDKNFKLIQEHTGYSEHMADELSAQITKYLEKK